MLTLPWRKKDEDFQWIKHEKTQVRLRREDREERLTAMGYLLRVCTSLLGLKVAGFFQYLLLKISRAKSRIFSWGSKQLPVHFSNSLNGIRSGITGFGSIFSNLVQLIVRAARATMSGAKWLIIRADNAMKALGNFAIKCAKQVLQAIIHFSKWLSPRFYQLLKRLAAWSGNTMRGFVNTFRSIGENSRNVTKVITQSITRSLPSPRQLMAYSALTLAVFAGVVGAVSMGVFSQLPKANKISGIARIIDADLIKVGDVDIRLFGIDAPEPTQTCKRRTDSRAKWGCGRKAVTQLSNLVNNNQVQCERKGTDNLGRIIAKCAIDNWDIAAYMVREGLAWVAPGDPAKYAKFEASAKETAVGIWRAKNDTPWSYREARWTKAKASAPEGCPVKGNISGAGRVYYLPWSNQYDRVRIQPNKGERWFCNEREAIQAGWRMTRYP